ncbi:putative ER lumen protein retaining receptor [Cardiosporidium cionae]|uniref:ER lumen protein retaining receptor n=1 Tax=Cardiosporidium cionae TaxID=476202 RepID=A0ABQ7JF16_9APIC|nr:putative ER lumen protein retaining receptor [Cardiosporidium cionae]|eukprot:KAF8822544.1 putative ER lumen protein retaining receptor [Cardiosporidium cionae]
MPSIASLVRSAQHKGKLKEWVNINQSNLKAWAVFFILAFAMYHLFSDGDFSFLLTLSSLIEMFSFLMVTVKVESSGSAKGVSLKMMECYVLLTFARLCSIIPFEGYLPYDRSGDWLYQLIESCILCLAGSIVYMCRFRYKETYDAKNDTFNTILIIVPSFLLAMVLHPSLNSFMPTDISWAFALYLESLCVLPQLFMFQKEVCLSITVKFHPSRHISLVGKLFLRCFLFSSGWPLTMNSMMKRVWLVSESEHFVALFHCLVETYHLVIMTWHMLNPLIDIIRRICAVVLCSVEVVHRMVDHYNTGYSAHCNGRFYLSLCTLLESRPTYGIHFGRKCLIVFLQSCDNMCKILTFVGRLLVQLR